MSSSFWAASSSRSPATRAAGYRPRVKLTYHRPQVTRKNCVVSPSRSTRSRACRYSASTSDDAAPLTAMSGGPSATWISRVWVSVLAGLRPVAQNRQRLLEQPDRLAIRRSLDGLRARQAQVLDGLVGQGSADRMMSEQLDLFAQPVAVQPLDRLDQAGVKHAAALL